MSSFKVYVESSVLTFISAFALAVLPVLGNMAWTKSALFALLAVGVRAGLKAIAESMNLTTPTTPTTTPTV